MLVLWRPPTVSSLSKLSKRIESNFTRNMFSCSCSHMKSLKGLERPGGGVKAVNGPFTLYFLGRGEAPKEIEGCKAPTVTLLLCSDVNAYFGALQPCCPCPSCPEGNMFSHMCAIANVVPPERGVRGKRSVHNTCADIVTTAGEIARIFTGQPFWPALVCMTFERLAVV
jgi:hypothetical protein